MNDFVIYTDSPCDIAPATLAEWGVSSSALSFRFDGEERDYRDNDLPPAEFYAKMKAGGVAKTSALNAETFKEGFAPILQSGKDILYIGFSGGLSATYHAGCRAAAELSEEYPERRIVTVDTLSGSVGEGLLVYLAVEEKKKGATLDEVAEMVRTLAPKVHHRVTVEDLVYLKRGGRISPALAFLGNALGLKPMILVNGEGKLENYAKLRGRKKALASLVEDYGRMAADPKDGAVFISHADCEEDAKAFADMLHAAYGVTVTMIENVGSVIGSHTGPGTLVLCFVGKENK